MSREETLREIQQTMGIVPEWLSHMSDEQLQHNWTGMMWMMGDSKLSGRDKALVSFGAAAAIHCPYCTPFHTAQLQLSGMNEEQIQEAAASAGLVASFSAYLHATQYDVQRFKQELDQTVSYMQRQAG